MLAATLVSFGVVFLAELGDKSQLIAMTYALRHRWWVVLSGVAVAAFLIHGLSVLVGHFLGLTLPQRPIAVAAALAFLGFAVWTWWDGRRQDDDGPVTAGGAPRYVVLAVISSYLLAELGDKTMLATVALASEHDWTGVWLGATLAMVVADGLAIALGVALHKQLPERFLHSLAGVLFLLVGLWLLFYSALRMPHVAVVVTVTAALVAIGIGAVRVGRARRGAASRTT
ncbi:TMEM165/GDT1 family protein [Mycobacterium sp. MYCO198283]|uniref:TMEM165/GDT1 family protein n=1 Tax=Mycobacterium sp. MYCO198283 TaxID=2883505 RepID=UPI001E54A611|nr:TMEM165/GDT1 family protein [Mycobacterium sp. MYCO198283]MCG5433012.1 TMEM165/GDT1 family protein [Mycobacterium sp. MYCO198283]